LIRSFSWVLSGDVASRVAVLFTTLVAVRALEPAPFGLYIVLYALALVAVAVWDLGVSIVVSREVGAGRLDARTALAHGSRLRLLTLPAWVAALAIGLALASDFPSISARTCAPFLLASASAGMSILSLAALRGAHRFSSSSAAQAMGKWSTAGLSVLAFVVGASDRLLALGAAFAAGELVTLVVSVGLIVATQKGPTLGGTESISLRESLPFAANAAMSMVYNRFDIVLVGALASASAAGLYGAASRSQDALYAIPTALAAVALPMISRAAREGGPATAGLLIRRFWKLGLPVAVPVSAIVFLAAPWLLPSVLGSDYSGAVTPLRILVWFLPLAVIQAPILAGLAGIGEGKLTTVIFLSALISVLALQLVLTPAFGATGGAIASLGRDLVATPLALLLAYRHGLTGRPLRRPGSSPAMTDPPEARAWSRRTRT
jgi:O-antigen/teichoic acid export membrane protein